MVSKKTRSEICHPTQVNGSDIQRKVVSTRIMSTPAFRPAHLWRRPTLANVFFWVQTQQGGMWRRSALGECSRMRTLEWKLRMLTDFSSTTQVGGRSLQGKSDSLTYAVRPFKRSRSALVHNKYSEWTSDKMALASTLCTLIECKSVAKQTSSIPRHGRVGRGREWSHPLYWDAWARLTKFQVQVPKTSPQVYSD